MANEFQHKDPGSQLTQAEYITTDGTGHIFDCQATGDIMYASSATVLKNLGKGAANTVLSMGGSCIPAWTASPSVTDLTIGGGCITLSAATDIDLLDNNASALSFDATGKTGIIDIVTTNCSEGVTMSGTLGVTGILTANAGVVVDNFTLDGTELDLSTGDFALDVAGDVEINADGGCINFKDASLALAAIVNTSCVGELRIHEAANYIGLKPPALSANQTWTWPATKGSCGEVLTCDGCGVLSWASAGGGVVSGGTDNAILRADGTGGSTSQGSAVTIADTTGDITLPAAGQFLAGTGGVCNPGYSFRGDTDLGMYRAGADQLAWGICCGEAMRLEGGGKFYLNESANGKLAKGITINQAGADNEILSLKSDTAHGVTCLTETDTFGYFKKTGAANGGLGITGLTDYSGYGVVLTGVTCGENTTKTTGGFGFVMVQTVKRGTGGCSTTTAAPGTDANLFAIQAGGSTARFLFDAEGTAHADVGTATYDDYCDIELMRGFLAETVPCYRNRFGQDMMYNLCQYEDMKLIGKDSVHWEQRDCGRWQQRAMVNFTGLTMLHHSTIIQMHDNLQAIIQSQEQRISQLENQLALGSK